MQVVRQLVADDEAELVLAVVEGSQEAAVHKDVAWEHVVDEGIHRAVVDDDKVPRETLQPLELLGGLAALLSGSGRLLKLYQVGARGFEQLVTDARDEARVGLGGVKRAGTVCLARERPLDELSEGVVRFGEDLLHPFGVPDGIQRCGCGTESRDAQRGASEAPEERRTEPSLNIAPQGSHSETTFGEMVRLYVGGLPRSLEPAHAERELAKRFAPFGTVSRVVVARTAAATVHANDTDPAQNRGFAHFDLDADDPSRVHHAMRAYSNTRWQGHVLQVQLAQMDYKQRLQLEWDELAAARPQVAQKRDGTKLDSVRQGAQERDGAKLDSESAQPLPLEPLRVRRGHASELILAKPGETNVHIHDFSASEELVEQSTRHEAAAAAVDGHASASRRQSPTKQASAPVARRVLLPTAIEADADRKILSDASLILARARQHLSRRRHANDPAPSSTLVGAASVAHSFTSQSVESEKSTGAELEQTQEAEAAWAGERSDGGEAEQAEVDDRRQAYDVLAELLPETAEREEQRAARLSAQEERKARWGSWANPNAWAIGARYDPRAAPALAASRSALPEVAPRDSVHVSTPEGGAESASEAHEGASEGAESASDGEDEQASEGDEPSEGSASSPLEGEAPSEASESASRASEESSDEHEDEPAEPDEGATHQPRQKRAKVVETTPDSGGAPHAAAPPAPSLRGLFFGGDSGGSFSVSALLPQGSAAIEGDDAPAEMKDAAPLDSVAEGGRARSGAAVSDLRSMLLVPPQITGTGLLGDAGGAWANTTQSFMRQEDQETLVRDWRRGRSEARHAFKKLHQDSLRKQRRNPKVREKTARPRR